MAGPRQQAWLTDVLEGVPSIVFLALWRSEIDGELAGWIGSGLAAALLLGFRVYRQPYNPILLGINLHLMVMTPVIVGVFAAGMPALGHWLIDTAETGVLVAVLTVGCLLTAWTPRGFVGVDGLPPTSRRTYSLALLALTAAAIPWSVAHAGQALMAVGLPLMVLFGLRRYLIARWSDKAGPTAGPTTGGDTPAVLAAPGGDPS